MEFTYDGEENAPTYMNSIMNRNGKSNLPDGWFLDASSHLYKSVWPSVGPSVGPSEYFRKKSKKKPNSIITFPEQQQQQDQKQ